MILLPRALPLAKGTVRVIFFVKVIFCAAVSDVEIADGGQRRVAEGLQQIGGTHGKNSSIAEIYR